MIASFPNGWINKVIEICNVQLLSGYSYGVGVIQSHSSLKQWLGMLETAFGRPFRRGQRKRWAKMFQRFFTQFDRQGKKVNEGGTIIKFMELVIRVTQRRWYIDAYGQQAYASPDNPSKPVYEHLSDYELQKYRRPRIPALGAPPVPSVLPFHTVCYETGQWTVNADSLAVHISVIFSDHSPHVVSQRASNILYDTDPIVVTSTCLSTTTPAAG
jgi:protein O-GlcNAc transferase